LTMPVDCATAGVAIATTATIANIESHVGQPVNRRTIKSS